MGSTGKIDVGTTSTLNTNSFTYTTWIQATSFGNAYNWIIGRELDAGKFCQLLIKSTGKLAPYISIGNGTGNIAYDGTGVNTLSTGVWYHLVMTYDSTNGLKGYVNGTLDGSAAANGNPDAFAGHFQFGVPYFTANRQFTGSIDDSAYFSRALSAGEVGRTISINDIGRIFA